jgi:hypothetical protein
MSRNIIFVLMYHLHKLLDVTLKNGLKENSRSWHKRGNILEFPSRDWGKRRTISVVIILSRPRYRTKHRPSSNLERCTALYWEVSQSSQTLWPLLAPLCTHIVPRALKGPSPQLEPKPSRLRSSSLPYPINVLGPLRCPIQLMFLVFGLFIAIKRPHTVSSSGDPLTRARKWVWLLLHDDRKQKTQHMGPSKQGEDPPPPGAPTVRALQLVLCFTYEGQKSQLHSKSSNSRALSLAGTEPPPSANLEPYCYTNFYTNTGFDIFLPLLNLWNSHFFRFSNWKFVAD